MAETELLPTASADVVLRWIKLTPHDWVHRGANGNAPAGCCLLCDEGKDAAIHRRTPPSSAGWQPISTAPKDGTTIWAANSHSLCVAYWAGHDDKCWRNWFKGCRYENHHLGVDAYLPEPIWFEPTHWQPLPPPPSQEGASEGEGDTPLSLRK